MSLTKMIGGISSMVTGGKQVSESAELKRKADSLFPEYSDPTRLMFANKIQRKADAMNTGSYATSLYDALENSSASMTSGALKLASGSGADVTTMLAAQRNTGDAFNKTLGTLEQSSNQLMDVYSKQLDQIEGRKLQLQMVQNRDNKLASEQLMWAGMQNKAAGLEGIVGGMEDMAVGLATGGMSMMANGKGKDFLSGVFGSKESTESKDRS